MFLNSTSIILRAIASQISPSPIRTLRYRCVGGEATAESKAAWRGAPFFAGSPAALACKVGSRGVAIGSSAGFRSASAVFTLTFVILFFFFLAPTILLFLQPPQPMSFTLTLNHGKQGRSNLHGRHRQQDLLPEGLLCPRRAPSNFHLQGSRATQNRRPSICEAREKTEDAVAPIFHSRLSFTHFCSTKTFLISVAGSSPSFL